jgi:hypothetical protein
MAKETLLQSMWLGYDEDKILRVRILDGVTVDLQQSKLMVEAMMRLADEKRFPVLIDGRVNYTWTKEAQEHNVLNSDFRLATAVLTNNPVTQLLTNTYVRIFKPKYPVRIFSKEEKAVAWLREFL